jgi:hypothetical protein
MRGIRWRPVAIGALVVALAGAFAGTGTAAAHTAFSTGPTGASGSADPVLVWSGYAEQAIVTGRPPASSAVLLGIVHIGMYDTAVALGLPAEPYLYRERAPRESCAAAAIATVAHHVLVARVSAQRAVLDAEYEQYLSGVRDGRARRAGVALGARHRPSDLYGTARRVFMAVRPG